MDHCLIALSPSEWRPRNSWFPGYEGYVVHVNLEMHQASCWRKGLDVFFMGAVGLILVWTPVTACSCFVVALDCAAAGGWVICQSCCNAAPSLCLLHSSSSSWSKCLWSCCPLDMWLMFSRSVSHLTTLYYCLSTSSVKMISSGFQ